MHKLIFSILFFIAAFGVFGEKISVSGAVQWDTYQIDAKISLDLAATGLRLPGGRTQAESYLNDAYLRLIRPGILGLQYDSSSTIGDHVDRGNISLSEIDALALKALSIPPAHSPDMRNMISSYTINLSTVSSALLRHNRPIPVMRTLNPVSTANYTGIVIIAVEELPVHGMRRTAQAVPCLYPKIWDSEMNLIYERSMLQSHNNPMVRYLQAEDIFFENPSGLSPELLEVVGDRPLRIFARGVFGIKPTDLIIDKNDALSIISSEENRRLLSQGKVAFIVDDSVLKYGFSYD